MELTQRLTLLELYSWYRYFCNQPRGEARADYHAAQISETLRCVVAGALGKRETPNLDDARLHFESQELANAKKALYSLVNTAGFFSSSLSETAKGKISHKIKLLQDRVKALEEQEE